MRYWHRDWGPRDPETMTPDDLAWLWSQVGQAALCEQAAGLAWAFGAVLEGVEAPEGDDEPFRAEGATLGEYEAREQELIRWYGLPT